MTQPPVTTELLYVQDPDLWFNDGSVVLEAEKTVFKVYGGILSQHSGSPVFGDMFSFPQPDEHDKDAETYDGRPLIHIPDSAHDLHHFLKALHDSSLEPPDILAITAVLRLSTKYEVNHLRARAITVLSRWYPPTLEAFIVLPRSFLPREEFPRHVLVANIARETDVPVLLPAALLLCCATSNARSIWDGALYKEDSSLLCNLVDTNKRAIFLGRPLLSHFARTRVQSFFFYPKKKTEKCQAPERCSSFCRIYSSVYDDKEDPWMNPFYKLNWTSIRKSFVPLSLPLPEIV
ncbi:hypothetical protein EW026_g487 [Hermanssonia centrifuga]|uniref:BTB domain-containing protein n=1 Tax=Hermanssonia centrifuga TaxID=98765 RepID=A0A4S4KV07_9APHY|nr:hypothetical protein EW026_g487 [Hermanssonia centrifuga]